jgi:hypothetical protein
MSLDSFMNDVVAYTSDEGMKGEKVMWKWFTQLPNLLMLQQNVRIVENAFCELFGGLSAYYSRGLN